MDNNPQEQNRQFEESLREILDAGGEKRSPRKPDLARPAQPLASPRDDKNRRVRGADVMVRLGAIAALAILLALFVIQILQR